MTPATHTARLPHTGYVHRGRGYGHTTRRLGKVHAATVDGFRAYPLCGGPSIPLAVEDYDSGDPVRWHVREGTAGVTCGRCQKVLGGEGCP